MSAVTDLVFITKETDWDDDAGVSRCPQFETMVSRYGYACTPAEDNGTKVPSTAVYFVGGVNYLSHDLVTEIKATGWPAGTVLYVHAAQDDAPIVTVFGQEPATVEVAE
jgi:hypothetical protein